MQTRAFSKKKEDFTCDICGEKVQGSGYTDHCPNCLHGKHEDVNPGDRMSECKGIMKPVKTFHNRTGFVISYVCKKCGMEKRVKAAVKDNKELLFEFLKA